MQDFLIIITFAGLIATLAGVIGWEARGYMAPRPRYLTNEEIVLSIMQGNIANGDAPDIAASHAWTVGLQMFYHYRRQYYNGAYDPSFDPEMDGNDPYITSLI